MAGLAGPTALAKMQAEINALEAAGGGSGTGTVDEVRDGDTTVTNPTTIHFTGAVVSESPAGTALVTVSGGGAKTGFSPVNIGSCDTSFAFDSGTHWGVIFLTKVEETMSLDNITVYGTHQEVQPDPADGEIEIMIYNWGTGWGSAGSTKKCGGTLATCGYGPNEIPLSAGPGEDLLVEAGENIMIAIRKTGGTFDAVAASSFSNKMYNQNPVAAEPAVDIPFPILSPSADIADAWGQPAGYAPACTLWENPA